MSSIDAVFKSNPAFREALRLYTTGTMMIVEALDVLRPVLREIYGDDEHRFEQEKTGIITRILSELGPQALAMCQFAQDYKKKRRDVSEALEIRRNKAVKFMRQINSVFNRLKKDVFAVGIALDESAYESEEVKQSYLDLLSGSGDEIANDETLSQIASEDHIGTCIFIIPIIS